MKHLYAGVGLALVFSCCVLGNAQMKQETQASAKNEKTKTIRLWDACDPDSFNAAVGPGTCVAGQHGTTLFQDFLGEVQLDKIAGGWRFNPLVDATQGVFKLVRLELKPGDQLVLQNKGSELHTFTRVDKYGGGFVECAQRLPDGTLIPQPESPTNQFVEAGTTEAGPTAGTADLPAGASRWQCCIHPWMRLTIVVKEHDHKD